MASMKEITYVQYSTEEGSRDEECQVEEDRLVHCWLNWHSVSRVPVKYLESPSYLFLSLSGRREGGERSLEINN